MAASLSSRAFAGVPLLAKRLTQRQAINVQTRAAFTLPALPYPVVSGRRSRCTRSRRRHTGACLTASGCILGICHRRGVIARRTAHQAPSGLAAPRRDDCSSQIFLLFAGCRMPWRARACLR